MKISKLRYETGAAAEFFEEGIHALGAVCERSWHDRLEVLAEGRAAGLWGPAQIDTQLHFVAPDAEGPRNAAREVFPGCPLMFRLAEALRPQPPTLERIVLTTTQASAPPPTEVAEKLWRTQLGATARGLEGGLSRSWHFSILALIRSEVQAIDQHWFLHRVALSLPDGVRDEKLASELDFCDADPSPAPDVDWPSVDLANWTALITEALREELRDDLVPIRARQESFLAREIARIDDYFETYVEELGRRHRKTSVAERITAARTEHERRRVDQVQRHEIRIIPHVDALVLVAEPAWSARVSPRPQQTTGASHALFVPRTRLWIVPWA